MRKSIFGTEKFRKIMLRKYGVINPGQLLKNREKSRQRLLEDNVMNRPEVKQKHLDTLQSEDYRKKKSEVMLQPEVRELVSRKTKENHPHLSGPDSPSWLGGVSFEPYSVDFTKEFKDYIRKKFNYTCQLCGKLENESKKKFCPHHINYDKKDSRESNTTLLCNSCNCKVNFNRQFWESQFNILNGNFDPSFLGLSTLWGTAPRN